jgi:hypothetical protein
MVVVVMVVILVLGVVVVEGWAGCQHVCKGLVLMTKAVSTTTIIIMM